jgi:hypothetical protein
MPVVENPEAGQAREYGRRAITLLLRDWSHLVGRSFAQRTCLIRLFPLFPVTRTQSRGLAYLRRVNSAVSIPGEPALSELREARTNTGISAYAPLVVLVPGMVIPGSDRVPTVERFAPVCKMYRWLCPCTAELQTLAYSPLAPLSRGMGGVDGSARSSSFTARWEGLFSACHWKE